MATTECVRRLGTQNQKAMKSTQESRRKIQIQGEPERDPIHSPDSIGITEAEKIAESGSRELMKDGFSRSICESLS